MDELFSNDTSPVEKPIEVFLADTLAVLNRAIHYIDVDSIPHLLYFKKQITAELEVQVAEITALLALRS